jgi:hypothetical protein
MLSQNSLHNFYVAFDPYQAFIYTVNLPRHWRQWNLAFQQSIELIVKVFQQYSFVIAHGATSICPAAAEAQ